MYTSETLRSNAMYMSCSMIAEAMLLSHADAWQEQMQNDTDTIAGLSQAVRDKQAQNMAWSELWQEEHNQCATVLARETELLEALRGLLAEDNMPASMSQHSIGAVKLALDAIKKAEGG